jgi:hypothetical protein
MSRGFRDFRDCRDFWDFMMLLRFGLADRIAQRRVPVAEPIMNRVDQ